MIDKYWSNKNKNCGLLTCIKPGGLFKKGTRYPYITDGGYQYLVLIPLNRNADTKYEQLMVFEDGTYRTFDLAIFKEVIY